eukprot:Plantae.Rhodophyta-Hildenbrandia_rubra.ctg10423.p1 GENE.Plantae.Rhodophyta-Hildenbrandia_rubra.ctg10423~~Plantae.Rhodophyta-Hildenbrandia_rubra.ctg10423.p1  ORF type:complete len:382 (+),score=85.42 Plantae.Rhodophyta-Hildenbrandia_rubra.ctg10423:170-1147(+)
MNEVFKALAESKTSGANAVRFVSIDTDAHVVVGAKFNVSAVPSFVCVAHGNVVDSMTGADVAKLKEMVKRIEEGSDEELGEDIVERLIGGGKVVIFGKESCEYSLEVKKLLKEENVEFEYRDVEVVDILRKAAKKRDSLESFPIVYAGGELVGGVDVVRELKDKKQLKSGLEKLVKDFASGKGDVSKTAGPEKKDAEKAAISGKTNGTSTATTMGGTSESGMDKNLRERLEGLVRRDKVMLFMKGEPSAPQCKFSRATVSMLADSGVKYSHFDILEDPEVRQGLKTFSNWPTYPQLYAAGSLVGGYDIIKELVASGELKSELGVE